MPPCYMGSGFKQLIVWQRSIDLAVRLRRLTQSSAFGGDNDLRRQINRAAVSIFSNIAEGMERDTDADGVRMLYIAKGSAAEVESQLIYATRVGYISQQALDDHSSELVEIRGMLAALIRKLRPGPSRQTNAQRT